MSPMALFASGETVSGFVSADTLKIIGDAFKGIQFDVNSGIGIALPIALGIMSVFFVIRMMIGFFKSVAQ